MSTHNDQLLLQLRPEGEPTLDNFVVGANRELIDRLRNFTGSYQLYLWGAAGSGRSHLLAAMARHGPTLHLDASQVGDDIEIADDTLLVIDDIEQLSVVAQGALFRIFIAAREKRIALLLSGPLPPLQLNLREDLRTRIGQMLIYEIKGLSDDEKATALHHYAQQRGLPLDDSVVRYLLLHGRRDLPSLLATIDLLDKISLSRQRPPTLPLLRELMSETR
ncbi:MAG: DnaA regulatory inactivator Hda [Georgfuchsia sp.]